MLAQNGAARVRQVRASAGGTVRRCAGTEPEPADDRRGLRETVRWRGARCLGNRHPGVHPTPVMKFVSWVQDMYLSKHLIKLHLSRIK